MLFDFPHVLFMLLSAIQIIGLLIICSRLCVTEEQKNKVLKFFAIITVIIHYSYIYVDYFSAGSAEIKNTVILAVYPCNVAMWLLLACSLIKNKKSKTFQMIAEFTFYLGIIGGIFGIVFNENYGNTPDLRDWDILSGLLSHVTMLFGCLYLLVGNYIKIRVSNLKSAIVGLIFMFADGLFIIGLYKAFKLDPPNCMFLLEPPLASMPWLNTYIIGIMAVVLLFIVTATYEQIKLPQTERWYTKLKK